ncbi:hypothetical protein [Aurantibacillus circumpalustris]|uniref:hypothetical protein n=1 Tax=Aurantibacillus circumpalustris TaxID=3036359 RepID=UPI00295A83B1|nr:hypothetical protein [Aurantibacillus circumpalustris]
MEYKTDFLSVLLNKKTTGLVVSINDLRDKEFSGVKLSLEEKTALANFDKYRINVLNAQSDEQQFHLKYRQIQVIANLSNWKEFLNEDFSS